MKPDWHFLIGGSGRVSSEGMADPLRNTELKPEELLIREAFQNSIDETIKNGAGLTFRIEAKKLEGEEKLNFISKLKFNDIKEKSKLFDVANNWYRKGLVTLDQFDDPNIPLRVLQISDHNANGLGGKWNIGQSIKDRFFNLVLSITKTKKQEEIDGDFLGSYGFGKMVFALSSNLRTMLYYSHFPKDERSGEDEKRLMASAFLPSFFEEEDELEFTGQAYFGLNSGQDNNPRRPITGKDADTFLRDLGFQPREQGDFGTTVIVPDCSLKIADLGKAVEKWWWPLLIQDNANKDFNIELIEDDGSRYEVNPKSREELFPFISAANNSNDNFSADKKADTRELKINVTTNDGVRQNKNPGKLSLLKLSKGSEIGLQNSVAIIRDNLVIEYWDNAFREDGHGAVGVFSVSNADRELKKIFTFSEPPAHDKISENHNRLMDNFGQYGSDVIRLAKNQIKEKSRDFQTTLEQVSTTNNTDALAFLDDLLGPLIKPRKKGPNPPPPRSEPRIQSIQKKSKVFSADGVHFSELEYELGLVDEANVEEMEFDLLLTCSILKDDVQVRDKILKITMIDEGRERPVEPGQTQKVTLKKGSKIKGLARSQIHPSWIISWGLRLDKSEHSE